MYMYMYTVHVHLYMYTHTCIVVASNKFTNHWTLDIIMYFGRNTTKRRKVTIINADGHAVHIAIVVN